MNATQTHNAKRKTLAVTLAALAAAVLLMSAFAHAGARKPVILDIDLTFVDEWTYCEPVQVHVTGRMLMWFDADTWTYRFVEPLRENFTSLVTGRTVSAQMARVIKMEPSGELDWKYKVTGSYLIKNRNGTWVDAGLVESVVVYDPEIGEIVNVTKSAGLHPDGGSVKDAICAALQ